jgi:hypothetical protein
MLRVGSNLNAILGPRPVMDYAAVCQRCFEIALSPGALNREHSWSQAYGKARAVPVLAVNKQKIRQLYSATHYDLGFFSPEMFLDIETVSRMVEAFNHFSRG